MSGAFPERYVLVSFLHLLADYWCIALSRRTLDVQHVDETNMPESDDSTIAQDRKGCGALQGKTVARGMLEPARCGKVLRIGILVSVEASVHVVPATEALIVIKALVHVILIFLVANGWYRAKSSHSIGLKSGRSASAQELP